MTNNQESTHNACDVDISPMQLRLIQYHALTHYVSCQNEEEPVSWQHLGHNVPTDVLFGINLLPYHGIQAISMLEFARLNKRNIGFSVAEEEGQMRIKFSIEDSDFSLVEIARLLSWGAVQVSKKNRAKGEACNFHELVSTGPLLGEHALLLLNDLGVDPIAVWAGLHYLSGLSDQGVLPDHS